MERSQRVLQPSWRTSSADTSQVRIYAQEAPVRYTSLNNNYPHQKVLKIFCSQNDRLAVPGDVTCLKVSQIGESNVNVWERGDFDHLWQGLSSAKWKEDGHIRKTCERREREGEWEKPFSTKLCLLLWCMIFFPDHSVVSSGHRPKSQQLDYLARYDSGTSKNVSFFPNLNTLSDSVIYAANNR